MCKKLTTSKSILKFKNILKLCKRKYLKVRGNMRKNNEIHESIQNCMEQLSC